jgi:hypothetical protein
MTERQEYYAKLQAVEKDTNSSYDWKRIRVASIDSLATLLDALKRQARRQGYPLTSLLVLEVEDAGTDSGAVVKAASNFVQGIGKAKGARNIYDERD